MWFTALALSFFIVAVPTILATAFGRYRARTLTIAAIVMTVFTLINVGILFWSVPGVGFNAVTFWHNYWWYTTEFLVASIAIGAAAVNSRYVADSTRRDVRVGSWLPAVLALAALFVGFVVGTGGVWTQDRATQLATLVSVNVHQTKEGAPSEVPQTDEQHILMVPRQVANTSAKQALQGNLGTQYELDKADTALASVNNLLTWNYPLEITSVRINTQVDGVVPGYISVNAENPNLPAKALVDDLSTDKVKYRMKYYPNGYWGHDIKRLIWAKYPGAVITDITLEPDDSGKPYFTASLDKVTLNTQPTIPDLLLVVDAWTGDIQEYKPENAPDWVDRVYSKETAEHLLDWWGRWGNPKDAPYGFWPWSETAANRYKVDDTQDPELVYVKGGHPYWQAILTSYNNDSTGSYFALVDARTGKIDLYQVPSLSLEDKAKDAIAGNGVNVKKFVPTHLTVHNIYGVLTWVAPLLKADADTGDEGESPFQGLAFLPVASGNSSSATVMKFDGDVKADALAEYKQRLINGTDVKGPTSTIKRVTVDGTVLRVGQPSQSNGVLTYIFILKEDPSHIYNAQVNASRPELPFIHEGAQVRIVYADTDALTRDVSVYDDLEITLNAAGVPTPTPAPSPSSSATPGS